MNPLHQPLRCLCTEQCTVQHTVYFAVFYTVQYDEQYSIQYNIQEARKEELLREYVTYASQMDIQGASFNCPPLNFLSTKSLYILWHLENFQSS